MAKRIPPHHAATPVRRRPSLDFSITGLVYCSMMMFMGLAAVNTQANLLFGVFGLMIGVLIVAGMISRVVLRRLKVRRLLPEHAVVGKPIALVYEFTNRKRRSRNSCRICDGMYFLLWVNRRGRIRQDGRGCASG